MGQPSILLIVIDTESARGLTLSADACARQTVDAVETVLVVGRNSRGWTVAAAAAQRLGVRVVAADDPLVAANEAVSACSADLVVFIPAGFVPRPALAAACAAAAGRRPDAAAFLPSIDVHSPDSVRRSVWPTGASGFVDLVADPTRVPSVVAMHRQVLMDAGGLDATAGPAAFLDLLLRVSLHGDLVAIDEPVIDADIIVATAERERGTGQESRYLHRVLEKHRVEIERRASEIFVERELAFGALVRRHQVMVARRDRDAAALATRLGEIEGARAWLAGVGETLEWGDFRRTDPISRDWGYDRGTPVDRHYIEAFLAGHSSDIRGLTLEVQEDDFSRRFGGSRVEAAEIVDLNERNPRATVVADLRHAPHIPDDRYDTIILTQTLHVIDDMPAVLRECRRILKPGGVLLATLPAASRVCLEYGAGGDLWRVTPAGAQVLMESTFGPGQVEVTPYGNVQTNVAFLHGLSAGELTSQEFDTYDPYYPALSGVRARKPRTDRARTDRARTRLSRRGVVLLYHRIDDTPDVHELNVTPAHFVEQLDWLRTNCAVMPLDDLLQMPEEDLPERAVALTFDDGYVDNLTSAAPRLEEGGLPATFFLTTRWLDEPGEFWWDTLERALLLAPAVPDRLQVTIAGTVSTLSTASASDRRAAHDKLHQVLVESTLDARTSLIDQVLDWAERGVPPCSRRPMSAGEALALSRFPGVTIGAHTVNHLALPMQTDGTIIEEVEESRTRLSRITGRAVTTCAYPYGAVDVRVAALLRERVAWGIACGEAATSVSFDAGRVPRVEVKDWREDELRSHLERVFGDVSRQPPPGLR